MTNWLLKKVNDQTVALYDARGAIVKDFVMREDLDKALDLLKEINQLVTAQGQPIYATGLYGGKSVWATLQQQLYLTWLRDFIKFEKLLNFLFSHPERGSLVINIDANLSEAASFVRRLPIKIHPAVYFRCARQALVRFLPRLIVWPAAMLSTALAVGRGILRPGQVWVYTPDKFDPRSKSDFRFQAVYDFLKQRDRTFTEVFHATYQKYFFVNLWRRRRAAIYIEAIYAFSFLSRAKEQEYILSSFSPLRQHFFKPVLRTLDQEAVQRRFVIRCFSFLAKLTRPQLLLTMDDPRYAYLVVAGLQSAHIPSFAFQHGHITKYHAGWLNYGIPDSASITVDRLFVWNSYWQNILLQFSACYNNNNVAVGGPLRQPPALSLKPRPGPVAVVQDLRILIPYESIAPKEEIKPIVQRLQSLGARIYFKLRPDLPAERQYREYGLTPSEVIPVRNLDAAIVEQIDAAVGVYTTLLYEIIFYEKPVLIMNTSFLLGEELVEHGVAGRLKQNFEALELLGYVNNFVSKKFIAWPPAPELSETLAKIFLTAATNI